MLTALEELNEATRRMERRKEVRENHESEEEEEVEEEEDEEETIENLDTQVVPLEDLDARKKAFLSRKIVQTTNPDYYNSKNPIKSKTTWTDLEPGQMKVIRLPRMTTNEIIALGKKTFGSMYKEVSDEMVASLLVLAYNGRDRDGEEMYEEVPDDLIKQGEEVDYNKLKTNIKKRIEGGVQMRVKTAERDKPEVMRDCYCFLSGVYMRLFTKSVDNFAGIEDKVAERFEHFYMANMPFDQFHPPVDAIKAIKSILELSSLMRNTFYTLLYAGEATTNGHNIKAFMYTTHISFTGLHPLVLFMKCMAAFRVGSGTLASTLHTGAYAKELRDICNFIKDFVDNEDDALKFKMWRFGRIFDDTFYATLQTRHCKRSTLALGYLLRLIAPDENQHVLKIAQISLASRSEREIASTFANRAYSILMNREYTGNYKGIDKILG